MFKQIFGKLSVRIILLILILGPIMAIVSYAILFATVDNTYVPIATHEQYALIPPGETLVEIKGNPPTEILVPDDELRNQRLTVILEEAPLIGIAISIVLGIIVASFITKPLRSFSDGINKLKRDPDSAIIPPTGISEFDSVVGEFNELAKELQKEEKLRKDLISDTSHELKTPIAALMGQLQGIQEGVLSLDPERIEILREQVDRLNNLVERLQEYTRIRVASVNMQKEVVKLYPLCKDIGEVFAKQFSDKGIEFRIDVSEGYSLLADKKMLERVLENLIENALKYADATQIAISADPFTLRVADNGKGIPEKNIPYIFERFYRVDTSRSSQTGGLGLGLAIVKEIVEAHGWSIKAHNLDKGVEFVITLKKKKTT
jgi:two-component system sensor histidine kinase BaeS